MKNTLLLFLLALPLVATADEAFVLKSPATVVTATDIERYMQENLPSDTKRREALIDKPGFFAEMAESLLVVRSLAAEAEEAMSIDREQARWAAELAYQRKLINQYRAFYIRKTFENVDWDSTAREAYIAEKDSYISTGRVKASHILIRIDENRSDEEAFKLASQLRERAVKGEDFEELAVEYSEDGSVERNRGNLGYFERGRMARGFENAAFAMEKPGEISEPAKTSFGYHVIKLHDKQPGGPIPFEQVKDQIIDQLQVQMGDQIWQDKVIAIRSGDAIEGNPEALDALVKKYAKSDGQK